MLKEKVVGEVMGTATTLMLEAPSPRKHAGKRMRPKIKTRKAEGMWQSPLEHIHLPRSMLERIHQLMASPLLQAELKHVCKQVADLQQIY